MDVNQLILLPISLTFSVLSFVSAKTDDETASICRNPNVKTRKGDLRGHDFFSHLVNRNHAFADKTLLMKDFVEHPAKVILVTCPRNWGKTMNIDMMKTFFQPEFNANNERVVRENASNYKLFALGKSDSGKITPMNIAKHQDFLARYLGHHPVIHLNLANAFDVRSGAFTPLTGLVFREHLYVFDHLKGILNTFNTSTSEAEKKAAKANDDAFVKFVRYNYTETEAIGSLKFLSERLHEYFGRKPFIFLDDYDKAINRLVTDMNPPRNTAKDKQAANHRAEVLRQLLRETFNENDHFEKGLIMGVMNLEIQRIFSSLRNFEHFNVNKNDFFRYFGLTEGEVALLSEECEIKGTLAEDAKKWYGGYTVMNDVNASLYNIQSVHEFLRTGAVGNLLLETCNSNVFKPLLLKDGIKQVVASLVNRTSYAIKLNDLSFTVDDYHTLVDLFGRDAKVTESGLSAYLRLLLSEGFLTLDHVSGSNTKGRANVKVPNEQVAVTLRWEAGMRTSY